MAQQINWLRSWDRPFVWPELNPDEIKEKQKEIEDYVKAMLSLWDDAWKIVHKRAASHKIKFDWHVSTSGPSYIVTAALTPPPTEGNTGGGQGSLLSPTPPPQP
ncbi:MAG TPA: hypothetical protein VFI33_18675 [Puia sp.]|nr:hypothetical protein [Puia sp.]